MSTTTMVAPSVLDPDIGELARRAAVKLRGPHRLHIGDYLDLGIDLIQLKAALGHRRFRSWLTSECSGTERAARLCMQIAAAIGEAAR